MLSWKHSRLPSPALEAENARKILEIACGYRPLCLPSVHMMSYVIHGDTVGQPASVPPVPVPNVTASTLPSEEDVIHTRCQDGAVCFKVSETRLASYLVSKHFSHTTLCIYLCSYYLTAGSLLTSFLLEANPLAVSGR